ncbi:MAG: saccharopine dehydrogenase NADP-binding domain-containing protein [Thermoanaerobaculales bacterium]|jgi:saccharopine dehydrogenase-like NADP-dependent oxidoreductase|nr:saccharopine dehydrogenase NADP-binding domain-containing protein [Thermoanaerobaculales bacterium]
MKRRVLVLGAGRSAPFLIRRLLDGAAAADWQVTVADRDLALAEARVAGHPNGRAIALDASDEQQMASWVGSADVVANVLAPMFQGRVARLCVEAGVHMVSVSYLQQETRKLDAWATERGVLLLGEMGLDPGIDHMMAAEAVREVQGAGGVVRAFRSFGSGVPAPDSTSNPLRYLVTWNPWNVATSGGAGAQYLLDGRIRIVPQQRLFLHTWPVQVEGVGRLEGYPNRDSLSYLEHFGLNGVRTMIRGTLRYPGFCETWSKIVKLGLTNDTVHIPNLASRSPREVVEMLLPIPVPADRVEAAATLFLELNPTGQLMDNLRFLGLFDTEPTGCGGDTAAAMLSHLLETRLAPQPASRDMVIIHHAMEVEYPDRGVLERRVDSMVDVGEPATMSAMARTVGLPTVIAVEMLLREELDLRGCRLPTHPAVCDAVLGRLRAEGLMFTRRVEPL